MSGFGTARRNRAALAAMMLIFSACATAPPPDALRSSALESCQPPGQEDDRGVAQPAVVERVTLSPDGRLFIQLLLDGQSFGLQGQLPERTETGGISRAPPILYLDVAGSPDQTVSDAGGDVTLLPRDRWHALLGRLQRERLSEHPGRGFVLDVRQERELFVYLDGDGLLRAVPLEFKPPEVESARLLTLEALLSHAVEAVRQDPRLEGRRGVLFETGDPVVDGTPFVFLDLEQGRVSFVQLRPSERVVNPMEPLARLNALAFHSIGGHLWGLVANPFSSVARLFTSATTGLVDTLQSLPPWTTAAGEIPPLAPSAPMDPASWESELDRQGLGLSTRGNLVTLVDGEEFFPRLIEAIQGAEKSIRMRLYIFDNDDYALKIADLLKRRSREVDVFVLLDGLGTLAGGMTEPDYVPRKGCPSPESITHYLTQDSEIKVRVLPNVWMYGDHTKTIVFDDSVVFLGGMNIGREYRYEWHDLMVELSGDAVGPIAWDFDRAWRAAGMFGDLHALFAGFSSPETRAGGQGYPIRILKTSTGQSEILRAQVAAMRRARSRIWLENAYVASDAVLYELVKARRRGVDVRVVLPFRSDAGIIDRSNALAANVMLANGIRVYIYPGMAHVKAALYDGWACLGSANFDRLSLRINRELNLATSDSSFVDELEQRVFLRDFEKSAELTESLPTNWFDHLLELFADQL